MSQVLQKSLYLQFYSIIRNEEGTGKINFSLKRYVGAVYGEL
jgi:hypothetical protein